MRKNILFFLVLFILINSFLNIKNIFLDNYFSTNIFMDINQFYSLESSEDIYDKVCLIIDYDSNCYEIEKLQNENNYIVGKIKSDIYKNQNSEPKKKYEGYFFINYKNYKDASFNLTKKDIKNKFSKNIKLKKAKKFLNENGYGSTGGSLDLLIIFNLFRSFFFTIIAFMVLLKPKDKYKN